MGFFVTQFDQFTDKIIEKKTFAQRAIGIIIFVILLLVCTALFSAYTEWLYYSMVDQSGHGQSLTAVLLSAFKVGSIEIAKGPILGFGLCCLFFGWINQFGRYFPVMLITLVIGFGGWYYSYDISVNKCVEVNQWLAKQNNPFVDSLDLVDASKKLEADKRTGDMVNTIKSLKGDKTINNSGELVTYQRNVRAIDKLASVILKQSSKDELVLAALAEGKSQAKADYEADLLLASQRKQVMQGLNELLGFLLTIFLMFCLATAISERKELNEKKQPQPTNQPQTDTTKELKHLLEDIRKNYNLHQANQKPHSPTPPKEKVEKDTQPNLDEWEKKANERWENRHNQPKEKVEKQPQPTNQPQAEKQPKIIQMPVIPKTTTTNHNQQGGLTRSYTATEVMAFGQMVLDDDTSKLPSTIAKTDITNHMSKYLGRSKDTTTSKKARADNQIRYNQLAAAYQYFHNQKSKTA